MYRWLIKPILFLLPPEKAHHFALSSLYFLTRIPGLSSMMRKLFKFQSPVLERDCFGLHFKNPVGLAAGFDKDAKYIELMDLLGFGFIEIGTVTPKPQKGNDLPRLFRLPQDNALINRMGFNNEGLEAAQSRLKKLREKGSRIIIGGNIGKNKITPNDKAVNDYEVCFEGLFPYVDYFVINVSSPNTPGLRSLQNPEELRKIFSSLQKKNSNSGDPKPLLVKIAPDLENEAIIEITELALEYKLNGIIACNTTISRSGLKTNSTRLEEIGNGGLSGAPVANRSTEVIQLIRKHARSQLSIIGVGGIQDGVSALDKVNAGADLIQIYTGFIYTGPSLVKKICQYMVNHQRLSS